MTDLKSLETRLFLKSEATEWAEERLHLLANGADLELEISPKDRSFFWRAKDEGCYLWMLAPKGRRPSSLAVYGEIATCYMTLAEAIALANYFIQEAGWQADETKRCLEMVARSQAALRIAVANCEGYADEDQRMVFEWLKLISREEGISISRGMTLEDTNDYLDDPLGEIVSLFDDFKAKRKGIRTQSKLMGKVKHKASLLCTPANQNADKVQDFMAAVDDAVKTGIRPSNRELREAVLPVIDSLRSQPNMPDGFHQVVEEVKKYQNRPQSKKTSRSVQKPQEVILKASEWLKGKSVVLIGGDERDDAKQALERTLGLKELIWIETCRHDSFESFGPFISRPDVAVVLLAIRWSSHSFGEVIDLCNRYGKPLVRLPAGYNPNQVAQQIVIQASEKLRKK